MHKACYKEYYLIILKYIFINYIFYPNIKMKKLKRICTDYTTRFSIKNIGTNKP